MKDAPSDSASFSGLRTNTPHAFVRIDRRAEIRSDFDHTNRVTLEDAEPDRPPYEQARAVRTRRTGSILLPFLGNGRIPRDYRMPVHIRPLEPGPQQSDTLMLHFEPDADRHRVAGYRNIENRWPQVLGPNSDHEQITVPAGWTGEDLRMCALTLAGDPRSPGPFGQSQPPTAPPDSPYSELKPGEVWLRLQHRAGGAPPWTPNDLTLFQIAPLLLQSNLEPARRLYVVVKETTHNFVYDVMEACWNAFGADGKFKRDFAAPFPASTPEKRRAAANAGDVTAADPDDEETDHPLLSPNKMYLIDGGQYPNDTWIQDQMAIGYCSAPGGRAFNVVLHCRRNAPLNRFVRTAMQDPDEQVFVFNGIAVDRNEPCGTTDYGGNIAVSPPVSEATDAEDTNWAGPPVPEHPPAPHGKIILGDCRNPHRTNAMGDHETGTVHKKTRTLLQSQGIQPIVPIDTSWLRVGHVDEILTFVPGADGPKLAMARPDVMDDLLAATTDIDMSAGRTNLHRGRHRAHADVLSSFFEYARNEYASDYAAPGASGHAQDDPESKLARSYDERRASDLRWNYRETNQALCREFLDPIEYRICHCTGRSRETDVLPLPVYFNLHPYTLLAEARTPNVVNMQVLKTEQNGTHLLVPDPCGPRLPPDMAETVVRRVLDECGQTDTPVQLPQDRKDGEPGFQFWAWPFLRLRTLALFFTHEIRDTQGGRTFLDRERRREMVAVIRRERDFNSLSWDLQQAVDNTLADIAVANPEVADLINNRGRLADQWHRLFIPEDTVDVVKAYTQSVLEQAGCTVHFVDDWFYHSASGEVHCGTNVLRKAPATDSPQHPERPPWWQAYPDLAAANTDYDPTNTAYSTDTDH